MWAHLFFARSGFPIDSKDPAFDRQAVFFTSHRERGEMGGGWGSNLAERGEGGGQEKIERDSFNEVANGDAW